MYCGLSGDGSISFLSFRMNDVRLFPSGALWKPQTFSYSWSFVNTCPLCNMRKWSRSNSFEVKETAVPFLSVTVLLNKLKCSSLDLFSEISEADSCSAIHSIACCTIFSSLSEISISIIFPCLSSLFI